MVFALQQIFASMRGIWKVVKSRGGRLGIGAFFGFTRIVCFSAYENWENRGAVGAAHPMMRYREGTLGECIV